MAHLQACFELRRYRRGRTALGCASHASLSHLEGPSNESSGLQMPPLYNWPSAPASGAPMPGKLLWNNAGEIGALLARKHAKVSPLDAGLNDIHRYVIELSEFGGDPTAYEENKLEAIRDAWNIEFLDRTQ